MQCKARDARGIIPHPSSSGMDSYAVRARAGVITVICNYYILLIFALLEIKGFRGLRF